MITIERKVKFGRGRRSRKLMRGGEAKESAAVPAGRVPRVSRLMALAIRFDQMIRDGVVADQAELARLGHVSRARLTQIMNLLSLAPEIQEAVLWLPSTESGRGAITERHLRPIVKAASWKKQRVLWQSVILGREQRSMAGLQA